MNFKPSTKIKITRVLEPLQRINPPVSFSNWRMTSLPISRRSDCRSRSSWIRERPACTPGLWSFRDRNDPDERGCGDGETQLGEEEGSSPAANAS